MAIEPMSSQAVESPSKFSLNGKLGKLHLFSSVDRDNRWPVQGWSSGDEVNYELDEGLVAEECSRQFNLDQETRWPLQGWCKAPEAHRSVSVSKKPSVSSRWPQGW